MEACVIASATRGGRVESRHWGAFAVVDASGALVRGGGDVDAPVFPRSAVKSLQALPLMHSGAVERFGLGEESLALACASHVGAAVHVAVADGTLAACGMDEGALECGAHWPAGSAAARALAASGRAPGALHNNCSGKHAGFVAACVAGGVAPRGYVAAEHPVMREAMASVERVTGARADPAWTGIDGCSIPTFAIPLRALALGFARIGTGTGMGAEDAAALGRLRRAVAAHPVLLAGEARFDTEATAALGEAVFVKGGAEGVHCAAVPALGIGIAVKAWDGAGRAAEAALAALLQEMLPEPGEEGARVLAHRARLPLRNWNGLAVGELRGLPKEG
jgi:L-asparaginase II